MSADNTVAILGTKASKGKKEYRVANVQALENLSNSDTPDQLNEEYAVMAFGRSRVFNDRRLAEGYAERIFDELHYVEYGIRFLDFTHLRFPQRK